MPANSKSAKKRRSSSVGVGEDYESDDGFVADAPKSKKPKTAAASDRAPVKPTKPANSGNGDDDEFWEITANRRVNISEFKGQRMVNIREYYTDKGSGAILPGKKGISLPLAQYSTFLTLLPSIEAALVAKGESVPRPDYSAAEPLIKPPDGDEAEAGEEDGGTGDSGKKKNFEATSEEDD